MKQKYQQPTIDLSGINLENPSPDVFDDKAEKIARRLADAKKKHNKPTQLRRFYDEYCQYVTKVGDSQEKLDELRPFIRMLRAKAAYSEGRDLVDSNFTAFVTMIVRDTGSPKALRNGQTLFEAVMGFLKLYKAD